MKSLIDGLLTYSKAGGTELNFVPSDCNAALKDALFNLEMGIKESNGVVSYDPLPTIYADPLQLMQLFQNLIANAIKFRAKERLPKIHVSARREKGQWVFEIKDNGIGIEPRFHDRIFVIFQRLHARSLYPGTGVGLPICKRIVERLGGRIWVESEPGIGSTFFFSVPDRSGAPHESL